LTGRRRPLPIRSSSSTADDLRDALLAHLEDLADLLHRHAFPIGDADRFVSFLAQLLPFPFQLALTLSIGRAEGFEAGLSLWRFSFRSCDLMIVKPITTNRLVRTPQSGFAEPCWEGAIGRPAGTLLQQICCYLLAPKLKSSAKTVDYLVRIV
jgi:hypothetical protein